MDHPTISLHEVRLFRAMEAAAGQWLTSQEIAERADIDQRTARAHAKKLSGLRILEVIELYPGYRYRLSTKNDRDRAHIERLNRAAEAFGIS